MLCIFKDEVSAHFKHFTELLAKAVSQYGLKITRESSGIYAVKDGKGHVWAIYGCDASRKACVIWFNDDANNPLVDMCLKKVEPKSLGNIGPDIVRTGNNISQVFGKSDKPNPEIDLLDIAKHCDDSSVSIVVVPKMYGAKCVPDIDPKELLAIMVFALMAISIIVDILEVKR